MCVHISVMIGVSLREKDCAKSYSMDCTYNKSLISVTTVMGILTATGFGLSLIGITSLWSSANHQTMFLDSTKVHSVIKVYDSRSMAHGSTMFHGSVSFATFSQTYVFVV